MPFWKKALFVAGPLAFSLLGLELVSLIALSAIDFHNGKDFRSVWLARRYDFTSAWRRRITLPFDDPWLQFGLKPGSDIQGLKANQNGFISNENPDALLNSFPEKTAKRVSNRARRR